QTRQAIQLFVFEVEHRIGIANRRLDQTLRIVSSRRLDDLQTGSVQEERFGVERVEWTRANARTAWTTKDCRQSRAPAITTLRSVVGQQIEAGGNEIDKLKLSDRSHSH